MATRVRPPAAGTVHLLAAGVPPLAALRTLVMVSPRADLDVIAPWTAYWTDVLARE